MAFKDGSTTYLGDFEKLELLNDNSALSEDVLANHPEIETWDGVLGNVVSSFS